MQGTCSEVVSKPEAQLHEVALSQVSTTSHELSRPLSDLYRVCQQYDLNAGLHDVLLLHTMLASSDVGHQHGY